MPDTSEQDFDTWIAARKQSPAANLNRAVMEAIHDKPEPVPQIAPKSPAPSWLVAFGCLLAGVGKLSLVVHLAF